MKFAAEALLTMATLLALVLGIATAAAIYDTVVAAVLWVMS